MLVVTAAEVFEAADATGAGLADRIDLTLQSGGTTKILTTLAAPLAANGIGGVTFAPSGIVVGPGPALCAHASLGFPVTTVHGFLAKDK